MNRRKRREDPVYIQAMKEAKELFEAEMAKSAMKGKGRPAKVATAKMGSDDAIEIDHEHEDEPMPASVERLPAKKKKK